ncbi:hypothetical protein HID58_066616, partial [Brassica napus]
PLPASSCVLNHKTKQKESLKRKQVFFFLSFLSPSCLRELRRWKITMISMYLVANFVVPSLLFKPLQGEEEEEEEDSD